MLRINTGHQVRPAWLAAQYAWGEQGVISAWSAEPGRHPRTTPDQASAAAHAGLEYSCRDAADQGSPKLARCRVN
jgi:hypothetical protein